MENNTFVEVLPNGDLRVVRSTNKHINDKIYSIVCSVVDDEQERGKIRDFLDGGEDIELIFGDRIMCG